MNLDSIVSTKRFAKNEQRIAKTQINCYNLDDILVNNNEPSTSPQKATINGNSTK